MNRRPAIFLDRDGTLIKHIHYLNRPEQVELLPGAAEALIAFRAAGYACAVITNQAAIAKGLLTEEGLTLIHQELDRQLAAAGAKIDAYYHCPLAGVCGDPTVVEFEDRKPGPGMILRAAREMNLDLAKSWMVGDAIGDVLAGFNAGCVGMVWIGEKVELEKLPAAAKCVRAKDIGECVGLIVSADRDRFTLPSGEG